MVCSDLLIKEQTEITVGQWFKKNKNKNKKTGKEEKCVHKTGWQLVN